MNIKETVERLNKMKTDYDLALKETCNNLIEQLFVPLASAIAAQGSIKAYQIRASILLLFPLIISYLLFKDGYPPYVIYIIFILYSLIASSIILYYTKENCQLSIKEFLLNVILRCFVCFGIVFTTTLIPFITMQESLLRLVLGGLCNTIIFFVVVYLIGFSNNERYKIRELIILMYNKVPINKFIL
jgi:hypothetical protein